MSWGMSRPASRALAGLVCLALQSACAAEPARRPPPPAPPPVVDMSSDEFRAQVAQEQAAALEKAARSGRNVTRTFTVGWEMHYGPHLIPSGADADTPFVMPDFLDDPVEQQFWRQFGAGSDRVGQRLVCECTGVAWTYYGQKRFLVRSARLTWVTGDPGR